MNKLLISLVFISVNLLMIPLQSQEYRVTYLGTRTTAQINQAASRLETYRWKNPLTEVVNETFSFKKGSGASFSLGCNFTSSSILNADNSYFSPALPQGWVGEKQYLLLSYGTVKTFDKKTGKPDGVLDTHLGPFFSSQIYITNPFDNVADGRVIYDRFSKRWFFSADNYFGTMLFLMVSSSSIITEETTFALYVIDLATTTDFYYFDQLGVDQNGVYLTISDYDSSDNFISSSIIVTDKESLLAGAPNFTFFDTLLPAPQEGANISAVTNFDQDPQFAYFIQASNIPFLTPPGNIYDQIQFFRVSDVNTTPALSGPFSITVPSYSDPQNAPSKGDLDGAEVIMETNYSYLRPSHVRDKQLYAIQCTQVNSTGMGDPNGDRVGLRWYQFDLTGDPTGKGKGVETSNTLPALVQSGTLFDPSSTNPLFYYMPSIMTNKKHNLAIMFNSSGLDNYVNIGYASRKRKDKPGTLRSAVNIVTSFHSFNFGGFVPSPSGSYTLNSWGDLSALSPDPVHDINLWGSDEWVPVENGWGIQTVQLLGDN